MGRFGSGLKHSTQITVRLSKMVQAVGNQGVAVSSSDMDLIPGMVVRCCIHFLATLAEYCALVVAARANDIAEHRRKKHSEQTL